jgi:conjugative relaxase-like TrwC/TraI family protein
MAMLGERSVQYHRATIVERADDYPGRALEYYGTRGETPLVWGGSGAGRLGLEGGVTRAQYSALLATGGAQDPTTGTRLAATKRPGMELIVSAHKSVAELGVIGHADDMHQILDAERDATLGNLDVVTQHRGGRRGRARVQTATGGLIYACTRHATSRAGDPCPHDHVLLVNLVEMADGSGGWKAADTALWRDQLHAATMVGRLAAARRAVELGYGIEPDPGPSGRLGHWRIQGIPDTVLKAHSKRSTEIDVHMGSRGFTSARARGIAARQTRKAKRFEPVGRLMERWHRELAQASYRAERLSEVVKATGRLAGPPPGRLTDVELKKLVAAVLDPDSDLARRKVFGRAEVTVAVAPHLFGRPVDELGRVVDTVLAEKEVLPMVGVPRAQDRVYTLADVIATETAIAQLVAVSTAIEGAVTVQEPAVTVAIAGAERRLGVRLTDGQAKVVRGICGDGRRVTLVLGVAGSGKTTVLAVASDAYRAAGYRVLGTATAGQAARSLANEADIPARTVASLRWRLEHRQLRLDDKTVLFLDEAGMTDDSDFLYLLEAASVEGTKVVLVGDDHQLGPVGAGGTLRALLHRHTGLVEVLDDNVRQADPQERVALSELRAGSVAEAIDWYTRNERIRLAADRDETIDQMVQAWITDLSHHRDTVMLAWRRTNVALLNQRGRELWAEMGYLTGPELVVPGGRRYQRGDRIVLLAPAPDGTLVTSQQGTVASVNRRAGALIATMDDGSLRRLEGEILSSERLDYAYALTVHRSQGSTVDVCHHLADGGGRELAYVAMSRARHLSTIWTVADNLDQAKEDHSRVGTVPPAHLGHRPGPPRSRALDTGVSTSAARQRRYRLPARPAHRTGPTEG